MLLPEIVTENVRVELDGHGIKMPLHSVIAIRVPTIDVGRKLLRYLRGIHLRRSLMSRAPRLAGGSVRIQVGFVRDAISRWLKTSDGRTAMGRIRPKGDVE